MFTKNTSLLRADCRIYHNHNVFIISILLFILKFYPKIVAF